MLCRECTAEHCLLKCEESLGGRRSRHPREGDWSAHELVLMARNTCSASKRISACDIVTFSLQKYINKCISVKHLENVIPVWWVCWMRKDVRELSQSLGSRKPPVLKVWDRGAKPVCLCLCVCVCNGELREKPRAIDLILAGIQK